MNPVSVSIPFRAASCGKMVYDLVDTGIGVVWSTAYLDEAERCATVVLLNEGKVVYDGPPKELTDSVTGRTFLIQDLGDQRRKVLAKVLPLPDVVDGVIQGSSVRLVMAHDGETPDLAALGITKSAIVPTPPRFEDAFVGLLGGGPKGRGRASRQRGNRPCRSKRSCRRGERTDQTLWRFHRGR